MQKLIYKRFCVEEFDEQNELKRLDIKYDANFNFAYDVVDEMAKYNGDKEALVWIGKDGRERIFSFEDLSQISNQAANVFLKHGITRGDRVMLILKRHYQYWAALLGLHKIGAVAIPSTHMLTADDIEYRIKDADVKLIVCTPDGDIPDNVLKATSDHPKVKRMIVFAGREGFISFDTEVDSAKANLPRMAVKHTDPMLLYYTSGTTGQPKGVSHNFFYPLGHIITAGYWQKVVEGGRHLTLADTGWAKAAWGKIYGQWLCGSAVMVYDYDHFYAHDILGIIEKYKVTTFCAPPTIYRYLVRAKMEKYDLSSLVHVTTAGEAMSRDTFDAFYKATGLSIEAGYGQTETTLILCNPAKDPGKIGSMGVPTPFYDVDLINDEGEELKPGDEGEIVIYPRGGAFPESDPDAAKKQVGIFTAYEGNAEQYEKVWENGIYHTGDLAYRDEDGYYWFVGRKDDVIKSSGYRIGPSEVEDILQKHPAVLECAVTGIPSKKRGYLIKATIVLSKGYEASDELKKEIQDYVIGNAAAYKCPRVIEFADELPKTANGKIRRDVIRKRDRGTILP